MTTFDCQRKIMIEKESRKRIGRYCGIIFYTQMNGTLQLTSTSCNQCLKHVQ